jgi:hypothetical protein
MVVTSQVPPEEAPIRDSADFWLLEGGRAPRTELTEFADNTVAFVQSEIARNWAAKRKLPPAEMFDARRAATLFPTDELFWPLDAPRFGSVFRLCFRFNRQRTLQDGRTPYLLEAR